MLSDNDLNIVKHHERIAHLAIEYTLKRQLPNYLVSVLAIPSHGKLARNKQQVYTGSDMFGGGGGGGWG